MAEESEEKKAADAATEDVLTDGLATMDPDAILSDGLVHSPKPPAKPAPPADKSALVSDPPLVSEADIPPKHPIDTQIDAGIDTGIDR